MTFCESFVQVAGNVLRCGLPLGHSGSCVVSLQDAQAFAVQCCATVVAAPAVGVVTEEFGGGKGKRR